MVAVVALPVAWGARAAVAVAAVEQLSVLAAAVLALAVLLLERRSVLLVGAVERFSVVMVAAVAVRAAAGSEQLSFREASRSGSTAPNPGAPPPDSGTGDRGPSRGSARQSHSREDPDPVAHSTAVPAIPGVSGEQLRPGCRQETPDAR